MEQHSLDLQLDLESDSVEVSRAIAALRPRATTTLTNSPGCTPASTPTPALSALREGRAAMRRVRVDAWSVPVSASWARPSRALRKVARRALESEAFEPI